VSRTADATLGLEPSACARPSRGLDYGRPSRLGAVLPGRQTRCDRSHRPSRARARWSSQLRGRSRHRIRPRGACGHRDLAVRRRISSRDDRGGPAGCQIRDSEWAWALHRQRVTVNADIDTASLQTKQQSAKTNQAMGTHPRDMQRNRYACSERRDPGPENQAMSSSSASQPCGRPTAERRLWPGSDPTDVGDRGARFA